MHIGNDHESRLMSKILNLLGIQFAIDDAMLTDEEAMAADGLLPLIQMVADNQSRENGMPDGLGYTFSVDSNCLLNVSSCVTEGSSPASVRYMYLVDALTQLVDPVISNTNICQISDIQQVAQPYIGNHKDIFKQESI